MSENQQPQASPTQVLHFFKGSQNTAQSQEGADFDWPFSVRKVCEILSDAINAKNVAFLMGSGCSSCQKNGSQLGITYTNLCCVMEGFISAIIQNPK